MRGLDALKVGLVQCLALVPGTSRSGATIIGGMLLGLSRKAATDFSFFLAIPTLIGAGAYSLVKERALLSAGDAPLFAIGLVFSFLSAWLCVRWLLRYIATPRLRALRLVPHRLRPRGARHRLERLGALGRMTLQRLTNSRSHTPVPERQPAPLELGQRPVVGLRRIAGGAVGKQRLGRQHLEHLLGIRLPVGGAMQVAARRQALGHEPRERRLHQTALVVPLLVPGSGKKTCTPASEPGAIMCSQHLDRVMAHEPQVVEVLLLDAHQQGADAGRMHLAGR